MGRQYHALVKSWKRLLIVGTMPLVAILSTGCEGMNHTEQGAVGGTAIGAGLGALFGHAFGGRGGTAAGAAIGGATGLIGGAIAGNAADKREEKRDVAIAQAQAQASANQSANIMQEVITLSQQHQSDSVIITRIRTSGVAFQLTADDILNLKAQGVSDAVINEMQASVRRVPTRQVYVREPVVVEERPVYIYREPPPPVGIGFGYYRRW
jgi:hypothetical protein